MRKLVTVRRVAEIHPIEGADVIELAVIDGWKSIVKKEYGLKVGGHCAYFEIDSFLPLEERYEFLRNSSLKKMDGIEGFRLKTMKMRGIVSQGLAQPIAIFPEIQADLDAIANFTMSWDEFYDKDYAAALHVQKYEPYISPENMGKIRGNFPSFIRKTDQERCQNIGKHIFGDHLNDEYEISLKLDGTSFTAFYVDGEEGVCSRNNELQIEDEGNKYVTMYIQSGLQNALKAIGKNYAVQGELMGPSIQNNREGLTKQVLYIFDIFDITNNEYLNPSDRLAFMDELYTNLVNPEMVTHVPIYHSNVTLASIGVHDLEQLLTYAEGKSLVHAVREGLVFKSKNGQFSFKAISNSYLLKQKD
jgi:RNA ligase (TIGR02306 family)